MASDFTTFFGTSADLTNAAAHADYPWLPYCGSMSSVVLNPACGNCSRLYEHKLPWRSQNDAAIPDAQRSAGAEFFVKAISLANALHWYGAGLVNPGAATLDGINEFLNYPPAPSARIVSASGQNLTVETDFHPLKFSYFQEVQENQNWFPGSAEDRFLVRPFWTRIQVGDYIDFSGGGSVLADKVQCRVVVPPTSVTSGTVNAYRWTVGTDQLMGFAATTTPGWPLEYALCNFVRYSAAPERWGEPMRASVHEVRRQKRIITSAAIDAATDGEIELTNTTGGSTAIAYPVVGNADFQGSVSVIASYPTLDPPVEIDVTAQTINEGRWRSVHNGSETQTFLSCGDTVNGVGGFAPLLVSSLGQIVVEYDAKAVGADGTSTRRSTGPFRCKHSKVSPDGRFFCGLASRRNFSFTPPPAVVTHDPPSGVDTYRADTADVGCYQWQTGAVAGPGTCGDYSPAIPFDYRQAFLFFQQLWAGSPALLEQLFPAITIPSAYRVRRPEYPSGVPGILFQLGTNLEEVSPGTSHVSKVLLGGTRWVRFGLNGDGILESWRGALFRNETDVQPDWSDDSTWQADGILGYRTSGGHVDGLGRAFDDTTDFGHGVRMARPNYAAESAIGYGGTVGGANERQVQRVDRARWFAAPQTSLFLGDEGASVEQATSGSLGVQVLPSEGDPEVAGDIRLRLIRHGGWTGSAKVGGQIYQMSLDTFVDGQRDIIKVEFLPAAVPIGFASIAPQSSLQGGNIVAGSSRFNARDYANANSLIQGAKPLIGAQPGDFLRVTDPDTGDAEVDADIQARGFCILRGLAYGGISRTPDYPEGWPRAAEVPYERGDVVWVVDENGLLAENLASFDEKSALVATDGAISPLGNVSVEFARLTPLEGVAGAVIGDDWTALDPADIKDINLRDGTILIDGDFLDLELRIDPESGEPPDADTRLCCWRVTCDWLTRPIRPDVAIISDTVGALEKIGHTFTVATTQGIPGGIMQVFQRHDRRTGDWGVTMEDVRRANLPELVPGISTFIVGEEVEYDEDANPYQELMTGRAECVDGYWIANRGVASYGSIDGGMGAGQHIRATSYAFAFGGGVILPQSQDVKAFAEISWGSGFGFNWGVLSRLPEGTTVTSATISAKFEGLRTLALTNRVYSNGDGTFSSEVADGGTVVEGSGTVRLGIAGTFTDETNGVEYVKLLGSGIEISATDGEWNTFDVTGAVNALLTRWRHSQFHNLFFIALGGGPQPDENAPEQLLSEIVAPTYNVLPYLSACSMDNPPAPVNNPTFYAATASGGLDVEIQAYVDQWSDVEVGPEMKVEIQLPSDPTGGVGFFFNDDYRHNSPADESVEL